MECEDPPAERFALGLHTVLHLRKISSGPIGWVMAILKLLATGAPVEQIAEVVSWRLSEIRNRVFGTVDTVEVFYIVDPAGALPSTQLEERLRTFESSAHFDIKRARYELVLYSVQRAVLIYGGYWNKYR